MKTADFRAVALFVVPTLALVGAVVAVEMTWPTWIRPLVLLALWAACTWGAMRIAEKKGLDGLIWAILGFLLGPIGVLLAMGMPRQR